MTELKERRVRSCLGSQSEKSEKWEYGHHVTSKQHLRIRTELSPVGWIIGKYLETSVNSYSRLVGTGPESGMGSNWVAKDRITQ